MADGYISQIKLPNEETYDFRDRNLKVYTGSCSTAAGTAIKDVVTDGIFTLEKGAVLFVNFTNTNSAAVGNLKLKINGEADTNAKPIKYLVNGNDPANIPEAGYLRANQTYMFRYDGTNWVADLNYYTYSNDFANKIGHYNNILARKAIAAESLIVGDETGYEKVASGVTFNLAYPIVWCTGAINANASNYANMFLQHYDRNIATGAKSGFTSTANKVIYLIVTVNGNIATIDSNIITDTLPSSDDGKVYISLGKLGAQSTGANYFFLYPVHPMFWYKNGAIREYSGASQYALAAPLSGISGADDLKAIEAISETTGLLKKTAANTWTLDTSDYVTSSGITSVTIGATSPVQSSTSTAQNGSSASTTISLKDAYGDTKNPYGAKAKNLVLAGPSSGSNAAPTFRALVAADIPSLAYVPATSGANDVNTLVNTGIYNITSGSLTNGPVGYGYGQLLVMSYRKHTGNTTTDWATQLYAHLGSGNNGNTLYFRTSNASTWQTWQMVAHANAGTGKGGTTTPIYINAKGEIQEGTALKDLAYISKGTGSTKFLREDGTWQTALTAHQTYTAFTGNPTANQTPGFGSTFTIQQISQDTSGQVSGTDRTVKIPDTAASATTAGLVNTDAQTFAGVKTFDNGIHVYGTISTQGTGSVAGTMYPGGAYHSGHNSIILHGDTAGVSGIGFTSEKATKAGTTTNINSSSDRAFIQYHAYGVTAAAEGTAPTLATSGELGTLVIGVGNDATDTIRLQAPGTTGILHQIGATAYPIPHTTNTNGSVGGTTTPVYVEAGVIKAGTALGGAAYKAENYYALSDHNHDSTYSYIHLTNYDFTDTQPLSKYVTFDKSRPTGAPKEEWYNGFISSHSNYHASYIINGHTNQSEWYVGHGIWRETNTPHATAPTWYLLAHSGNVGTGDNNGQVKIAGENVSVKGLKALAYKDSLSTSDIPNLSWNKITSDKPTTISGYGITDAKITSGTITLGSNTISPITEINWDSTNKKLTRTINGAAADVVTAATLRTDLGLSNALHFIGVTSTTLADGSTTNTLAEKSTGSLTKTTDFVDGDVVMDGDQLREYVWSGSAWRLLGITTSTTYTQPASTATNTWIAQISQGTDGKITATTGSLNTSGTWSGNAATATKLKDNATNRTKVFYRGDNTWSNILKQTAASALGIDTNHKIGTAIKDLHFTVGSGSGTGINDGNAGGITIGTDTSSYGGIYWQSSGSYGLRLHFATTGSFANGAYTRMLITSDGKVGIGTLTPDTLLTVNGNAKADKFIGALSGNADTATSAGKWTTARTLTIGSTGKSVDGSGNVSWNLSEIGAAPASTVSCTTANVESALGIDFITYSDALNANGWKTLGGRASGAKIAIAYNNNPASWNSGTYSASLVFGCQDTRGLLDIGHQNPIVTFGGASNSNSDDNNPKWYFKLSGTSGQTYTFPAASKTLAASDGSNASGSWGISITGSAGSVAWANTGHPSTFPPSAHTHYELVTIGDKRNENTTPNTYANRIIFQGLKTNTIINSPYTDAYSYLVGLRGWSDSSGGNSHELAFNGNGIYRRQGVTTAWGNWFHILDSNNTYAASTSDVSINWNTSTTIATINGTAIKVKIPANPNSDTKNTAGSTNSDSKLYLIGATSQDTNPQTYSDAHVFEINGAFSAKTLGVNADTDNNKVTLQWNSTDSSLDFIFA